MIVDDEEVNRAILSEIFCDDYDIAASSHNDMRVERFVHYIRNPVTICFPLKRKMAFDGANIKVETYMECGL